MFDTYSVPLSAGRTFDFVFVNFLVTIVASEIFKYFLKGENCQWLYDISAGRFESVFEIWVEVEGMPSMPVSQLEDVEGTHAI